MWNVKCENALHVQNCKRLLNINNLDIIWFLLKTPELFFSLTFNKFFTNLSWSTTFASLFLLFCFFRYRLGHLNNRQTKIAENSTIHFFWKLTAKQVFGDSFRFFDSTTTKWRSIKFFSKLNGNHILMANFSKLRKYQTFVLIELHNLSKGQLADRIFKLWKSCVYDYRVVEHTFFEILTF